MLACNFLYTILHVLPTGSRNAEGFTEQKRIGKNKTKQKHRMMLEGVVARAQRLGCANGYRRHQEES